MARESGGKARRRLFLAGLIIALVPMTAAPRHESTCDRSGPLVCVPVELIRIFAPLARRLLVAVT